MGKINKERLIELRCAGIGTTEIANEFACSNYAVLEMTQKLVDRGRLRGDYKSGFWVPEASKIAEAGEDVTGMADIVSIDPEEYVEEKHLQNDTNPADQLDQSDREAEAAKVLLDNPPPKGVMARKEFYIQRKDDLRRAICEYACEGLVIDPEWVDEYNELSILEKKYK